MPSIKTNTGDATIKTKPKNTYNIKSTSYRQDKGFNIQYINISQFALLRNEYLYNMKVCTSSWLHRATVVTLPPSCRRLGCRYDPQEACGAPCQGHRRSSGLVWHMGAQHRNTLVKSFTALVVRGTPAVGGCTNEIFIVWLLCPR